MDPNVYILRSQVARDYPRSNADSNSTSETNTSIVMAILSA